MQSINGGALLDNLLGTGTGLVNSLLGSLNLSNPLGNLPGLPNLGLGLTIQVNTGTSGLPNVVIGLGSSTQS